MAKRGRKPKKEQLNVENQEIEKKETEQKTPELINDQKINDKTVKHSEAKSIIEQKSEPVDFTVYEASKELGVKEEAINLWIQHGHLVLNKRRNITTDSLRKWENRLKNV